MSVLVVGIGNTDRGDDAIGLLVADQVNKKRCRGVAAARLDGTPLQLLERWTDRQHVVVVDALHGGGRAGTIVRFDASRYRLPGRHGGGAHDASLVEVIELSRALGTLPPTVLVYGVVGRRFALGDAPTSTVLAAVEPTAGRIVGESIIRSMDRQIAGRP